MIYNYDVLNFSGWFSYKNTSFFNVKNFKKLLRQTTIQKKLRINLITKKSKKMAVNIQNI